MALKAFHLKIEKIQIRCFGARKRKRLETNLVYVAYKYTTNAKEITKIVGKVKYSKEKFLESCHTAISGFLPLTLCWYLFSWHIFFTSPTFLWVQFMYYIIFYSFKHDPNSCNLWKILRMCGLEGMSRFLSNLLHEPSSCVLSSE